MTNTTIAGTENLVAYTEIVEHCDFVIADYVRHANLIGNLAASNDVAPDHIITAYVRLASVARFAYLLREKVTANTSLPLLRRWLNVSIDAQILADEGTATIRFLKVVSDRLVID
jgi:hypothetical protein